MAPSKLSVGQRLEPFVIESVDPEPMKVMAAILEDPNPIHYDTAVTSALGMGDQPVNQGPTNMTWLLECVQRFAGGSDKVKSVSIRFLGNVLGGERFEVSGEVTAIDEDAGEAELQLTATSGGRPALGGIARIALP